MTDSPSSAPPSTAADEPLRLHIGGWVARPGWKILNIQPGPGVDFVGGSVDLSRFSSDSVADVYASHVYEHLDYQSELPHAMKEVYRVLAPGGRFMFSVPDLETLCKLLLEPKLEGQQRFHVMRMMFGGRTDEHDFHKVGITQEFAYHILGNAGFTTARRVAEFGLFNDTSVLKFAGVPISLNIQAAK